MTIADGIAGAQRTLRSLGPALPQASAARSARAHAITTTFI